MLIFGGLVDQIIAGMTDMLQAIALGAKSVGHKVTADHCVDGFGRPVFEKVQYLKFSPIMGSSKGVKRYYPSRNVGTLCRGLGKVNEDLTPQQVALTPAEWRVNTRSQIFNKYIQGIISGWKHEPSHPLLAGLRDRFLPVDTSSVSESCDKAPAIVEYTTSFSDVKLDLDSLCRRYDVAPSDFAMLYGMCQELQLGSIISSTVLRRAMEVDYGLSFRRPSPSEYTFVHTGVGFAER